MLSSCVIGAVQGVVESERDCRPVMSLFHVAGLMAARRCVCLFQGLEEVFLHLLFSEYLPSPSFGFFRVYGAKFT